MIQPLTSLDIFHHLKIDSFSRKKFKNVLPKDRLPKNVQYPSAYVINTHKSNQPGEHWLAVFYNKNGKCTFFDSFGFSPNLYGLERFIEKSSTSWEYNSMRLQEYGSVVCGYYCIYFIQLMSRGLELNEILILFSQNFSLNDFKISNLLE
jgi:hypothetical protein